jgi:hypothetical protein
MRPLNGRNLELRTTMQLDARDSNDARSKFRVLQIMNGRAVGWTTEILNRARHEHQPGVLGLRRYYEQQERD